MKMQRLLHCKLMFQKIIECIATINKAIEKWGRIDALINNAGTTKFAWDHSDLDSLDC